ncbi:MAG: YidC/Oxa1 family membrane protein insertase [Ruminococcus sp.]|nr:YidC/Oxa1 family membrane protein insertase [Ruminococcus sp.]MDE6666036.1 YidC/Oxa1 family membrane protein insertase [Ruminococcus sp.]
MNSLYDIIGIPFGYLMYLIYSLCHNYAFAIIIFTVVTKLLLFPVNYHTQKSSARMQLLNPKMEKLRKSFASNPQRLQEEQQKLYQQEGINPMGSCLPAFVQMFLLFGVIDVVYKPITHILHISKNVRQAAFNIAINLDGSSAYDFKSLRSELVTMEQLDKHADKFSGLAENFSARVAEFNEHYTIFGANLGKIPEFHPETWNTESVILFCIPFLAGLAQLVQSIYSQVHQKKTNPQMQGGGCMALMMYIMPVLSVVWAFALPAGIGFYWIWSSLFSFLINLGLNQYFTPERTEKINEKEKEKARIYAEKHPEKKTFMQRMLEQQAALEQQQNGNSGSKNSSGKVSRSEMNKQNRDKIKEARKRMAEKYGEVYDENDDGEED